MERKKIDIQKVFANEGQIDGLPRNPRTMREEKFRTMREEKFRKLVKSIRELPEMTEARDLLVVSHGDGYVVVGGNMRLQAYRELGWKEVPCCILPEGMPADKLREIVIQDNNPFGETDWDMIANEWDVEELKDWGVDLPESWIVSPDAFGDGFSLPDGDKPNSEKMTFTLSSEQSELIKEAIDKVKYEGITCDTFGNDNQNGNAIYQIVKEWVERKK